MIPVFSAAPEHGIKQMTTSHQAYDLIWLLIQKVPQGSYLHNTLPLRIDLRLVHDHNAFSLHFPALGKLNKLLHLSESFESIAVDGDIMFGDELQHIIGFLRRADKGPAQTYISEDQFLKGNSYVIRLLVVRSDPLRTVRVFKEIESRYCFAS
jgi:hypothetical protein